MTYAEFIRARSEERQTLAEHYRLRNAMYRVAADQLGTLDAIALQALQEAVYSGAYDTD